MTQPDNLKQQQARRMLELFDLSRQRYLDAGGDPRRSGSSLNGNDYLSDEERQEFFELGRQVFDVHVNKEKKQVSCKGQTWTIGTKVES